jgi:hypothetical protein
MSGRTVRRGAPGLIAIAFLAAGCTGHSMAGKIQGASQVPLAGALTPASTGASPLAASSTPSLVAASLAPPSDLVGLDGPELEHLLGAPGLVRRDYPAEVWQYRNPACVLDVYLYPDHDRLTVTHAEARASVLAGDALSPCIAKFAELRHKTTG